MRSWKRLFEQVITLDNLERAFKRASQGTRRFRPELDRAFFYRESILLRLHRTLGEGTWRPGAYRVFSITDPKPRVIAAAPFEDRIVHHAIVGVLELLYEPTFIHHSYCCRKGKGQHRALETFARWARSSAYVLRGDISRFFPTLDHRCLIERLRRRLRDEPLMTLIGQILASGEGLGPPDVPLSWFPGDDLLSPLERPRGLPIGNLTSQFFGNVIMDALDHFVTEGLRLGRYLRYGDDFAVFGAERSRLQEAMEKIRAYLGGLRLRLHPRKTQVAATSSPLSFLGYVHTPKGIRMPRSAVIRFRRRLRALQEAFAQGQIEADVVRQSIAATLGHFAHADAHRLSQAILRGTTFQRLPLPTR